MCCFVTRNDELLLAQRGVEPRLGEWALPGGFVELGETTEEAAVREMHEETALHVDGLRLIGVSTQPSRLTGAVSVLGYMVERWTGEPAAGSDVMGVRFFPKSAVPSFPFRAHRELFEIFQSLWR